MKVINFSLSLSALRSVPAIIILLVYYILPATLGTPVFAAPKNDSAGGNPQSLQLNEKGVTAMKAKDYTVAESLFRQAVELDKGNLTAVFNLAGVYMLKKQEPAAISLLEEYAVSNPKDAGIYVRLGDAHFSSEDVRSAVKRWEHAYSLSPNYVGLASRLGTAYSMLNRVDDAIKMYTEAAKLDPSDSQLFANLSALYVIKKNPEDAVSNAKQALKLKPSSDTYITLGHAYEAMGDYKNSLISYKRASDLGDKSAALKERIKELEKATS